MGEPKSPRLSAEVSPITLDVGDTPPDLDRLAQQLFAIASRLRDGSDTGVQSGSRSISAEAQVSGSSGGASGRANVNDINRQNHAQLARSIYQYRRKRDDIFGTSDLFGEPAWDILLDLYVAEVEGKAVSVSSACIGSASPSTTGLRWLGVLAEAGLVAREHDPEDQRRVLVRLSAKGLQLMDRYFAEIRSNP